MVGPDRPLSRNACFTCGRITQRNPVFCQDTPRFSPTSPFAGYETKSPPSFPARKTWDRREGTDRKWKLTAAVFSHVAGKDTGRVEETHARVPSELWRPDLDVPPQTGDDSGQVVSFQVVPLQRKQTSCPLQFHMDFELLIKLLHSKGTIITINPGHQEKKERNGNSQGGEELQHLNTRGWKRL